jgi:hypothetical protein
MKTYWHEKKRIFDAICLRRRSKYSTHPSGGGFGVPSATSLLAPSVCGPDEAVLSSVFGGPDGAFLIASVFVPSSVELHWKLKVVQVRYQIYRKKKRNKNAVGISTRTRWRI